MTNPFSLKRPSRATGSKTFTDPGQPGVEIPFTLSAADALVGAAAVELVEELAERFEAVPFLLGEEAFPVPRPLLQAVAVVHEMQTGEHRWDVNELIAWAIVAPHAWSELMEWTATLAAGEKERQGNSPGAATHSS